MAINKKKITSCAIILAAGTSTRMGQTKQLLSIDGQTILGKIITDILSHPFDKVYTVIGHEAAQIQEEIMIDDSRFEWLYNSEYQKGQSTSLKIALRKALLEFSHVFIFLGDLPLIKKETIVMLLETSLKSVNHYSTTFLVRPMYKGIVGHPVFLGNMTPILTEKIQGDQGIKSIRDEIADKIILPVEDVGVIFDIDTPNSYKRLKKHF